MRPQIGNNHQELPDHYDLCNNMRQNEIITPESSMYNNLTDNISTIAFYTNYS